jgi:hypothetical protein
MNINRWLCLTGLCLTLFLAKSAFSQGLYWESTTSGGPMGDKGDVSQNYAIQKMYKMVNPSMTMILRMDKQAIYTINPGEKTYTEMTFTQMESIAKKAGANMEASRAKFQEKLKAMSPERQKQMEGMNALMGGGSTSPLEVTTTGEKKSVSGYSCTKYVMKRDNKELAVLWVTNDVGGFDVMRKDWMEFGKRMASLSHTSGMSEAYSKIDGFPMETDMLLGSSKMVTLVTKIEKRSTSASEFEVPAGYTRAQSPLAESVGK